MRAETLARPPISPGQTTSFGRSRLVTLFVVWLCAIVLGYVAYERFMAPAPVAPKGQLVSVQRGSIAAAVNTTGSVVASTTSRLSFKTSGLVAELFVKMGDSVQQGQPLARIDQTDLELQVLQSKSQVASADAKLAQLQQGSRAEEIVAAEANLASAKTKLAQLQAGPTDADLQAAQASLASANSTLASAQAKLADLHAQPKADDIRAAQVQLEKAKNSLWSTQIDRDGTCGNPRNAEYQCNSANVKVAAAINEVTNQTDNLTKVSQPAKPEDIKSAEGAVASAQASYDSTSAKLQQVKVGATSADIAAAQAAVDAATSQLKLKRLPYTDADLKGAQASVEQAKASLASAEYQLKNATLLAPFAGNIATQGMNLGEVAGSSSTITLVDPKALRIDATVDESDVAKLEVGQPAEITFDSLPNRRFAGKVIAIAPTGTVQSGVVTYLVSLSLTDTTGLRPGMTANANIVYSSRENVLVVPNRALRTQGRTRVAEVVGVDGQSDLRTVQVGLSNDQFTEITGGLAEGDQVIIPATTTTAPRVGGGLPGAGAPTRPGMIMQR